jgi:hypothetical protein
MSMQGNCWIAAIHSKKTGHIQLITAKFCIDELQQCQDSDEEVIKIMSCRKIKPATLEYQTLRAMSDQMDTNTPIVRYLVTMQDRPVAPRARHLCLKDKRCKYWKTRLWNKDNKNATMILLPEPVANESLPGYTKVYPSIITVRVKENQQLFRKLKYATAFTEAQWNKEKISTSCVLSPSANQPYDFQ